MSSFLDVHAHGGKRALLRFGAFGVAAMLGAGRGYRRIDWPKVGRLVFVCNGNICRSPFAEAVARRRGFAATSAGIAATNGSPAAAQAIASATRFNIDLSSHQATHIGEFEFVSDDLVIGFEPVHLERLGAVLGDPPSTQISLLAAWLRPPNLYIHDPYGASVDYFQRCFRRIERAVDALLDRRGA